MTDSGVSHRKFFMHAAHPRIGVSAGLAALTACDLSAFAEVEETSSPPKVCLVSGSPTCRSDESLAAFQWYLRSQRGAVCACTLSQSKDGLPGEIVGQWENLDGADCMLLFARRMELGGEPLDHIKRYCRRGGAIVGVRTAGQALQDWPEMDKEVFGGDYRGHDSNRTAAVQIVEAARDHPVLAGVGPFVSGGALPKHPNLARDVTVLLHGTVAGHSEPVAWTRLHRGGRVFYTSLGHPNDFRRPEFLRLLANAVHWSCQRCGN